MATGSPRRTPKATRGLRSTYWKTPTCFHTAPFREIFRIYTAGMRTWISVRADAVCQRARPVAYQALAR